MRKTKIAMAAVFMIMLFAISLVGFLMPDKEFSENENRYLAKAPQFRASKLMSGDYQQDLEAYLNDQVCFRDFWIAQKTVIQKTAGVRDIGDAYIGKDGYQFEKILPEDVDEEQVAKNTDYMADYIQYATDRLGEEKVSFMLLPTSGLVLQEKLPSHAILFPQEAYLDEIENAMPDCNIIDMRERFAKETDTQLYYKTDHHWTTDGAYLAYEQWCDKTNHPNPNKSDYERIQATDTFRGTLYSKILAPDSAYDSICIYESEEITSSDMYINGTFSGGVYKEEKLLEKNKYEVFLGGNYGEVQIVNFAQKNGENLLIIKDSFANAYVPFMVEHYENVYMIDLRYYSGNIPEYMEEKGITEVLILYNISNFISDKNIFKLTRGL